MKIDGLLAVCERELSADDVEINPQRCTRAEIDAFFERIATYVDLGLHVLPAALRCLAAILRHCETCKSDVNSPIEVCETCGEISQMIDRFEAGGFDDA